MITNGSTSIFESVEQLLGDTDLGRSYDLHVLREASREENDWLYVVVAPQRPGIRAYEFADLLAKVEERVRQLKQRDEIMLVPARVD